ncbi:MAG: HlyD family secretion protein [Planctomycetota bacterium]|nr:HlyD family secretion protein [Planctomycetota bacterium]
MKAMRMMGPLVGATFGGFALAVLVGFLAKMDVVVTAPGEIRPIRYAELRPVVEGRVIDLYHSEGDYVKAGEPILRIDAAPDELARAKLKAQVDDFENQLADQDRQRKEQQAKVELARASILEAEADVATRKVQLRDAQTALAQAKAQPEALEICIAEEELKQKTIAEADAKKLLEDNRTLLEKGVLSQHSYEKSESAYKTACSETEVSRNKLALLIKQKKLSEGNGALALEKAEGQAASARAEVQAVEARLEKRKRELMLAELALEDRREADRLKSELERARLEDDRLTRIISEKTMCAPIAGIIHDFHVKVGQTISHKDNQGWVYDVTELLFYAYTKQVDMMEVAPQQPALLYIDALPYRKEGTFDGQVVEVGQIAEAPETGTHYSGSLKVLQSDPSPRGLAILKILPEPGEKRLRVGFPGYAEITVGRASIFEVLFDTRSKR